MADFFWSIFDVASNAFALLFYLFVAGLGVYAIASVIYNVAVVHRRRREERPEPPTARQAGTVYPDRKGGDTR